MDAITIRQLVFDFYGIHPAVGCYGRRTLIHRRAKYACVLLMREYKIKWIDISASLKWKNANCSYNCYNRARNMFLKDHFFIRQMEMLKTFL